MVFFPLSKLRVLVVMGTAIDESQEVSSSAMDKSYSMMLCCLMGPKIEAGL